jgi:hypothetical protein
MNVTFATASDVWEWGHTYRAHGGPLTRPVYRCILAGVCVSDALAVRDAPGGALLAVAGIVDLEPFDEGEVFFLGPPQGKGGLGRRLVVVWRLAEAWLAREAGRRRDGIVCHVRLGNGEGERLARSLQFIPEGMHPDGQHRRWRRR